MEYETWNDFYDEWGDPDSCNYAIEICGPNVDFCFWQLVIAQTRKGRIQEVFVKEAEPAQVRKWAKDSLRIVDQELFQAFGEAE